MALSDVTTQSNMPVAASQTASRLVWRVFESVQAIQYLLGPFLDLWR